MYNMHIANQKFLSATTDGWECDKGSVSTEEERTSTATTPPEAHGEHPTRPDTPHFIRPRSNLLCSRLYDDTEGTTVRQGNDGILCNQNELNKGCRPVALTLCGEDEGGVHDRGVGAESSTTGW